MSKDCAMTAKNRTEYFKREIGDVLHMIDAWLRQNLH
jgi:hypothetical protein